MSFVPISQFCIPDLELATGERKAVCLFDLDVPFDADPYMEHTIKPDGTLELFFHSAAHRVSFEGPCATLSSRWSVVILGRSLSFSLGPADFDIVEKGFLGKNIDDWPYVFGFCQLSNLLASSYSTQACTLKRSAQDWFPADGAQPFWLYLSYSAYKEGADSLVGSRKGWVWGTKGSFTVERADHQGGPSTFQRFSRERLVSQSVLPPTSS